MSQSWRIEQNFADAWGNVQKRLMAQERRPSVNNASQILGPGAGAFAIELSDWNAEEGTFNGIFYSVPGAFNAPDDEMYWLGETFGVTDEDGYRWGFQRLTRYRLDPDGPGSWDEYRRRFYPQGELVTYSAWEVV